jgi:hypothetical protein
MDWLFYLCIGLGIVGSILILASWYINPKPRQPLQRDPEDDDRLLDLDERYVRDLLDK